MIGIEATQETVQKLIYDAEGLISMAQLVQEMIAQRLAEASQTIGASRNHLAHEALQAIAATTQPAQETIAAATAYHQALTTYSQTL